MLSPETKSSGKITFFALIKKPLVKNRVVLERGASLTGDLVQFGMLVVVVLQRKCSGIDEGSSFTEAATELDTVTTWIEFNYFRVRIFGSNGIP